MSRIDFVGLARQTAGLGTKVTTMEYFVPVESSATDVDREELTMDETIGTRFPTGLEYGTRFFTIPMAGAPRMASVPRVLSGFLGQATTAGAGPYTHTFDPTLAGKNAEPHSIFVVRADPAPPIVDLFWDARGNEIALDVAANDFLRFDASWIAIDLDDTQTAPVATSDLTNRRKFSECTVEYSEDGGTTWEAELIAAGFGITYSNNLDTDNAILGDRKLYGLPMGNANCEVRFSPRSQMNEFYRRNLEADPDDLAIRMTADGGTGNKFTVLVHSAEITAAPAPVSGADVLKSIEIVAQARIHPSTGKFVTVTVENAVATYA